jgi:hypothetical protein
MHLGEMRPVGVMRCSRHEAVHRAVPAFGPNWRAHGSTQHLNTRPKQGWEGFKYLLTRSGPIATGGMDQPAMAVAWIAADLRPSTCRSISRPAPSASRAPINASSRRRELAMMPSAAGPTVTIRSYR